MNPFTASRFGRMLCVDKGVRLEAAERNGCLIVPPICGMRSRGDLPLSTYRPCPTCRPPSKGVFDRHWRGPGRLGNDPAPLSRPQHTEDSEPQASCLGTAPITGNGTCLLYTSDA